MKSRYAINCSECGYLAKAAWFEPLWLVRKQFAPEHAKFHATGLLDNYPGLWQADGVRLEQARIISVLESLKGTCDNDCDDCRPFAERNAHYLDTLIALIKGEQK